MSTSDRWLLPSNTIFLFDLGGVLVDASGIQALNDWCPDLAATEIRMRWHASNAVNRFERGEISANEFASRFVAEWPLPLNPEDFLKAFSRWVGGFYPGAIDLLARLKTRYTVACLSNTNEVHWGRLAGGTGIFHHCFPSHKTGHMKPDLQAYEKVVTHFNTDPKNIVFFDDLESNVDAAQLIGMRAFLTAGMDSIETVLRRFGVS